MEVAVVSPSLFLANTPPQVLPVFPRLSHEYLSEDPSAWDPMVDGRIDGVSINTPDDVGRMDATGYRWRSAGHLDGFPSMALPAFLCC